MKLQQDESAISIQMTEWDNDEHISEVAVFFFFFFRAHASVSRVCN